MLSQMREGKFIRTVLWIVVVAFVATMVFVWGADLQGIGCSGAQMPQGERWVGMVGEHSLSLAEFDRRLQGARSQYAQGRRPDQPYTAEEDQRLSDQIFNDMVNTTLFALEVERLGLTPSDEEIIEVLQFDPPEFLRRQFMDEQGNFDANNYQAALNNPNLDWRPFEEAVRADLPRQRLVQIVTAGVHVGEGDIRQEFERQFAQSRVRYAGLTFNEFTLEEEDPGDEVLESYLQDHVDDYQEPERYRIAAVEISRGPSPDDEAYVRERMDFVRGEIEAGKNFEDMARDYSMDLSNAEQGGDLGWFGKGRMHPDFEKVAFAMADGEVSEPVTTSFGMHLIKKEGSREENGVEEINARHILLRVEASYATRDSVSALVDSLYNQAQRLGELSQAAAGLGLTALAPAPFGETESIEGLGFNSSIKAKVKNSEPGDITRRFVGRDADYLIQLIEVIPPEPSPLAKVRSRVLRAWQKEEKSRLMREQIRAMRARIDEGLSFAAAAEAAGLTVIEGEPFRRVDYLEGIGTETAFQFAAFLLNPGDISGIVESGQGIYLLEVLEKIPSDKGLYEEERAKILKELKDSGERIMFENWLLDLKERFPVQDFRDEFYN